jgi:hypothetical protein
VGTPAPMRTVFLVWVVLIVGGPTYFTIIFAPP